MFDDEMSGVKKKKKHLKKLGLVFELCVCRRELQYNETQCNDTIKLNIKGPVCQI